MSLHFYEYLLSLKGQTIILHIKTCLNSENQLFNFRSQYITQEGLIIQSNRYMYRNKSTASTQFVQVLSNMVTQPMDKNSYYLGKIEKKQINGQTQFWLKLPSRCHQYWVTNKTTLKLYSFNAGLNIVVNTEYNSIQPGFPLDVEQIIKFGELRFKILQIKVSQDDNNVVHNKNFNYLLSYPQRIFQACQNINIPCRICLQTQCPQHDLLVSKLCNCKGGVGPIHVNCLKKWMSTKISYHSPGAHCKIWTVDEFICQICKEQLPYLIKKDKQHYDMLSVKRPNNPYMLVQYLQNGPLQHQKDKKRIFCVFDFTKKDILTLGSSDQSNMPMTHQTISSKHAEFILDKDKRIYLKDLKSKYGTFVEAEGDIRLKGRVKLQSGRNVYEFICE